MTHADPLHSARLMRLAGRDAGSIATALRKRHGLGELRAQRIALNAFLSPQAGAIARHAALRARYH